VFALGEVESPDDPIAPSDHDRAGKAVGLESAFMSNPIPANARGLDLESAPHR